MTSDHNQGGRLLKVLKKPANDNLSRDIRRYQVRLKVTAAGVLIFAFWSVVRSFLVGFLRSDERKEGMEMLKDITRELTHEQLIVFTIIMLIVFLILFMIESVFRIWIFILARRESNDPSAKRRYSYIVLAWLLIIGCVYTIYNIARETYLGDYALEDGVISIMIEFFSMITLGELIEAAGKLRKLRDEQAAEAEVQNE